MSLVDNCLRWMGGQGRWGVEGRCRSSNRMIMRRFGCLSLAEQPFHCSMLPFDHVVHAVDLCTRSTSTQSPFEQLQVLPTMHTPRVEVRNGSKWHVHGICLDLELPSHGTFVQFLLDSA